MDEVLRQALAPVLRDLAASSNSARPAELEEHDWTGDPRWPSAMIRSADGTARGVSVDRSAPSAERIASAADHVQEWVIEELWGSEPTNWPVCPLHPDSHPLRATVRAANAWWDCPRDSTSIVRIGAL